MRVDDANIFDALTGEMIALGAGSPLYPTPDVDGDGLLDLCADKSLVLTSPPAPFRVTPIPGDIPTPSPSYPGIGMVDTHSCLPDLTGDGLGDLLRAEWGHEPGYLDPVGNATITLHPGGPDGYGDALWSLPFDHGVPTHIVALQADDDPQLEVALVSASISLYIPPFPTFTHISILDQLDTLPNLVAQGPVQMWMDDRLPPELNVLPDHDGDGKDELVVIDAVGGLDLYTLTEKSLPDHQIRVLASTRGYDPLDPLFTLGFEMGLAAFDLGIVARVYLHVDDVDSDGFVDIYALGAGSKVEEVQLQVWYGPLYVPPEPLPHTGDTGTLTTPLPHTGTTPDTGHTAATTPPPGAPPHDARGCHCATTSSSGVLAWLIAPLTLISLISRRGRPC